MRAVSVHTYLGGMQVGVARQLEVVAAVETWDMAIRSRGCHKCHSAPLLAIADKIPEAGIVFANPPCSRYSTSAIRHYSDADASSVEHFDDLLQVIDVARRAKARVVWWETGPLMWGVGKGMAASAGQELGARATAIVRIDCRWVGVPQVRPRCHVLHFLDEVTPRYDGEQTQPPTVGEFVFGRTDGEPGRPVVPRGWNGVEVERAVRIGRITTSFGQSRPHRYHPDDEATKTVLGGRQFAWELDPWRWWGIREYGALMGVPGELCDAVAKRLDPGKTLTMLSKGVSADVTEHVLRHVVQATLAERGEPMEEYDDGRFTVDLGVPRPRKGLGTYD